jgi:hypothetical protein
LSISSEVWLLNFLRLFAQTWLIATPTLHCAGCNNIPIFASWSGLVRLSILVDGHFNSW